MHEILDKYGRMLASVSQLVLILMAYWLIQGYDLVRYDDDTYVFENDRVLRGLSWEGFRWAFEEAIRLEPQYAHAHYQLSLLLKSQGRLQQYFFHYRQAVESNPAFAEKPFDPMKR